MKGYGTVIFCIVLILITFLLHEKKVQNKRNRLKNDGQITIGQIIHLGNGGKTGDLSTYSFRVDELRYEEGIPWSQLCKKFTKKEKEELLKVKFQVVYSSTEPEKYSEILLSREDYKRYNLSIPIELEEIVEEYFECN